MEARPIPAPRRRARLVVAVHHALRREVRVDGVDDLRTPHGGGRLQRRMHGQLQPAASAGAVTQEARRQTGGAHPAASHQHINVPLCDAFELRSTTSLPGTRAAQTPRRVRRGSVHTLLGIRKWDAQTE